MTEFEVTTANFEEFHASLDTQPITGWDKNGNYVSLELISHITDNLYVGGHSAVADLGDFFSHVFSFYVFEDRYKSAEGVVHEGFHMYDSNTHPDLDVLDDAVPKIVAALEAGGNVLVHCQAGINRSNLAAALTLMQWKGLTAEQSIDMLRQKRGKFILSNRSFYNYLMSLDSQWPDDYKE